MNRYNCQFCDIINGHQFVRDGISRECCRYRCIRYVSTSTIHSNHVDTRWFIDSNSRLDCLDNNCGSAERFQCEFRCDGCCCKYTTTSNHLILLFNEKLLLNVAKLFGNHERYNVSSMRSRSAQQCRCHSVGWLGSAKWWKFIFSRCRFIRNG